MSRRNIIFVLVTASAVIFAVLALRDAAHLQSGYKLAISLSDQPASISHIAFPLWLKIAHVAVDVCTLTAIALLGMMRRAAVIAAWSAFLATSLVGNYDIVEYGTMGFPTSGQSMLLSLTIAILATYCWRVGELRRSTGEHPFAVGPALASRIWRSRSPE